MSDRVADRGGVGGEGVGGEGAAAGLLGGVISRGRGLDGWRLFAGLRGARLSIGVV